eukprot:NODE_11308_length_1295_cov_6.702055.p5 GENE.NODE_11308_length_1295_cov_6.702055~~NODE_11308_length_1295_cov_6.702055.p5  ORF type:complete len:74 (+),score=53.32 NODE_11308_length_1295_cov_6.702055:978-1199(+)
MQACAMLPGVPSAHGSAITHVETVGAANAGEGSSVCVLSRARVLKKKKKKKKKKNNKKKKKTKETKKKKKKKR